MNSSFSFPAAFYDGLTSAQRAVVVTVSPSTQVLTVAWDDHQLEVPFAQVRIDARLGNTARCIYLPGDALLETADNDAVDRFELARHGSRAGLRAHALEQSWPWALGAAALVAVLLAVGFRWGVPWLARKVSEQVPPEAAYEVGKGALEALDKAMFEPSALPAAERERVEALLGRVAKDSPGLPLHLECRKAGQPNAFALPDGTVIVTDEFVSLAKSDEELLAVLAHEAGHVKHRHALRLALENSAIGLVAFAYLGDASQLAGIIAGLPTLLAHAHFSQAHETEADTEALTYLRGHGLKTAAFADILERMTAWTPTGKPPTKPQRWMSYLESHPGTDERARRFRSGN